MGQREMFLVLGAMFFFTMNSLSVNRFCLHNSEIMMQSEFDYYAISLAQRIIEEGKTRLFDSVLETGTPANPPDDFTYPLGPRNDEHYPNFTDVDDYNGLTLNVNTPRGDYVVSVQVGYVKDGHPDDIVTEKTYYKKITVTVSSDYISDDVVLEHVYSYYDFG